MVTAIIGVGELVRDFGLSSAAVQARTLSRGQKSNLFWINTSIGFALMLLTIGGLVADRGLLRRRPAAADHRRALGDVPPQRTLDAVPRRPVAQSALRATRRRRHERTGDRPRGGARAGVRRRGLLVARRPADRARRSPRSAPHLPHRLVPRLVVAPRAHARTARLRRQHVRHAGAQLCEPQRRLDRHRRAVRRRRPRPLQPRVPAHDAAAAAAERARRPVSPCPCSRACRTTARDTRRSSPSGSRRCSPWWARCSRCWARRPIRSSGSCSARSGSRRCRSSASCSSPASSRPPATPCTGCSCPRD